METVKINTDVGDFYVGVNSTGHISVRSDNDLSAGIGVAPVESNIEVGSQRYKAVQWFELCDGKVRALPSNIPRIERLPWKANNADAAKTHKEKIIEAMQYAAEFFVTNHSDRMIRGLRQAFAIEKARTEEHFYELNTALSEEKDRLARMTEREGNILAPHDLAAIHGLVIEAQADKPKDK